MRGPDDAGQHGLTCSEGSFSLSTTGVFVVIVIFLRLDVAVRVFLLMDDTTHPRLFLCLSGKFERDLES